MRLFSVRLFPLYLIVLMSFLNSTAKSASLMDKAEANELFVGKTFFYMFGRERCKYGSRFFASPNFLNKKSYSAETPQSFVVQSIVKTTEDISPNQYYQVRFEDGFVRYINAIFFKVDDANSEFSLKSGCLFGITPDELNVRLAKLESEKKKAQESFEAEIAAAAEKERKRIAEIAKRPNARIGMTAKEVENKTNWGRPEKINRTITADGVTEQWIYGEGEYLYFHNGRLAAIQTQPE